MILENIGEGDDDALLCVTNYTACCKSQGLRNWFFPNETRVPSDGKWDLYRTRDQMMIRLNRRRSGEEGIYHCQIPDTMNVTQTLYIGVYSATTGEWWLYIHPCSVL